MLVRISCILQGVFENILGWFYDHFPALSRHPLEARGEATIVLQYTFLIFGFEFDV